MWSGHLKASLRIAAEKSIHKTPSNMHTYHLASLVHVIKFFANIIKTSWHVNFNHIFFAFASLKILPLLPSNFLYMTAAASVSRLQRKVLVLGVMKEWWFRLIFIMMIGICCITPLWFERFGNYIQKKVKISCVLK